MTSHIPQPLHFSPTPDAEIRLQKLTLDFGPHDLYTDNPKDDFHIADVKDDIEEEDTADELVGSRISGIVVAVKHSRQYILIQIATLYPAARLWIKLDASIVPQDLYNLAQKHLALGDRIIVTIANAYRDDEQQVMCDGTLWELVAPNLIDWNHPEALESRSVWEAAQVRAMTHRTEVLGVGLRSLFTPHEPLNITDGSPYVIVTYPNTKLLNAVRMSGRPAFMLSAIPGEGDQPSELGYDMVVQSSYLCDQHNNLEVSPEKRLFFVLRVLSDKMCGGHTVISEIKDFEELANGCEIDLSVVPTPISFYDLILKKTKIDFRKYSSVEEACKAAGPLLPPDKLSYNSVTEVALAVARYSVYPTLIRPTVVVKLPALIYKFAHRYGTNLHSETNSGEIYASGRLLASYHGVETDPRRLDFSQQAPVYYDAEDFKAIVYAGLEPMTRIQIFIDNLLALFEPGIE